MELSVAQILAHAGVQAPTLYHHFGDKEGLYVSWACAAVEAMGEGFRNGRGEGGLESDLAAMAGVAMDPKHPDLIQMNRDLAKLERDESRQWILNALQEGLFEPIYATLLAAMAQGRLRQEPVHPAASVFLTGAVALRPGGLLSGAGADSGARWWVERFLLGFRVA